MKEGEGEWPDSSISRSSMQAVLIPRSAVLAREVRAGNTSSVDSINESSNQRFREVTARAEEAMTLEEIKARMQRHGSSEVTRLELEIDDIRQDRQYKNAEHTMQLQERRHRRL